MNRSLVYIASPYSGDIENNVKLARDYCRFAVSEGVNPVAAHLLYPQFLKDNDLEQRQLGLALALELLRKCDQIWVFGEYISKGMAGEIDEAERVGITVVYKGNF